MQYNNRISALEDEKVYVLNGEGIVSVDGTMLYSNITAIHLKYAATRYYTSIYKCVVKSSTKTITLSNRKYIKMATFEYQSVKYNDFVTNLHLHIDQDAVKLQSGIDPSRFWIEVPIAFLFFTVLLAVLFSFGGPIIGGIFALMILVRLGPYYFKNFPKKYQADAIPKSTLPRN